MLWNELSSLFYVAYIFLLSHEKYKKKMLDWTFNFTVWSQLNYYAGHEFKYLFLDHVIIRPKNLSLSGHYIKWLAEMFIIQSKKKDSH